MRQANPLFKDEEIKRLNNLIKACLKICKQAKVDIYGIGLEVLKGTMNG